jgi:hypothetical protein
MPIRINFTRGNRGQRGVDRFGVELSTGECQLRIVEEPLGRIVFPTIPCLEAAVVETGEEGAGIDGRDLDSFTAQ